ncbi:MAG: NAD-dependent epimerase/dehydratase family protein [Maricaulaceae bacterium]
MIDRVLVTGISGFIGSHVAAGLVAKGYQVRGTVRSLAKGHRVLDAMALQGVDISAIELVEANLAEDAGWHEAVADCRFIQHIASPFPSDTPTDREALVPEARAGAQRVLEHGFSAGAERIVMTSSMIAMMGRAGRSKRYDITEESWSDPDWKGLTPYAVSKTRAELSAWAYVEAQGLKDKLVTVCPGLVLGPDLFGNAGTSLGVVKVMLKGGMSRAPKLAFPVIDVRDCADIHIAAMTAAGSEGRRLLAGGQTLWMNEIAQILRKAYPENDQLPKGELPNILMKFGGLFDARAKSLTAELGLYGTAKAEYVSTMTQVMPRSAKEAVLSAAENLINNGL